MLEGHTLHRIQRLSQGIVDDIKVGWSGASAAHKIRDYSRKLVTGKDVLIHQKLVYKGAFSLESVFGETYFGQGMSDYSDTGTSFA